MATSNHVVTPPRKRLLLQPTFADQIARAGLSMKAFAAAAGVERTTLYLLLNPTRSAQRKGGMQRTTAWKIAHAYAHHVGITPEAAYAALIIEAEIP